MDTNNLAVNSVVSPYLISSCAGDERLHAALILTLDDMCPGNAGDLQRDMQFKILANLGSVSFWYRLGVHDERPGRV